MEGVSSEVITDERLRMFFAVSAAGIGAVADAVPCPSCGAPAGQDCPPNEFGKRDVHVARARAWEASGSL